VRLGLTALGRTARTRLFDASAGLSLAGCVPAVPASVSPTPRDHATAGRVFQFAGMCRMPEGDQNLRFWFYRHLALDLTFRQTADRELHYLLCCSLYFGHGSSTCRLSTWSDKLSLPTLFCQASPRGWRCLKRFYFASSFLCIFKPWPLLARPVTPWPSARWESAPMGRQVPVELMDPVLSCHVQKGQVYDGGAHSRQ
jgi:hypothetical protein